MSEGPASHAGYSAGFASALMMLLFSVSLVSFPVSAQIAPPLISKVFNPTTIVRFDIATGNGISTLTFTITNPAANTVPLNGVAFTDTFPGSLRVDPIPGFPISTCGGTTMVSGGPSGLSTVSLTGGTVAVNSSCTFTVNVASETAAQYNNVSGNVSSTNGGMGNTASATLIVATPPVISKSFTPRSIPFNGNTSLTFTISNANSTLALTGVAFTDTLPSGLAVSTPNGLIGACGGGTITALAGSSSVSLSGGTLAAGSSCTLSVNVTGTTAGVKSNTVTVNSTEAGIGNTATASMTVVAPPATNIPTLSEWALIILGVLLGVGMLGYVRGSPGGKV